MARPRISLLTLTAVYALAISGMSGSQPASAEPKKVSKGSGQYEEHYELVPDDDPNAPPPANAGNLDPEGGAAPSKSKSAPPAASHKGPFVGAGSAPPPAKKPVTSEPAQSVTAYPQPERIDESVAGAQAAQAQRDGKAVKPETVEKTQTRQPDESAPRSAIAGKPAKAIEQEPIEQGASQEHKLPARAPVQEDDAAVSNTAFFYSAVNEGGAWMDHPRYGRVFAPKVDDAWRPYTQGRWAYSDDYGWVWASDEPFGWAAYHYGRWALEADKGWFWVPGTQWAPAWVVWRQGEDAIGWAALPPSAEFTAKGLSLEASVIESSRFENAWVFVDPRYFGQPGMRRYLRSTRWNADLVHTTVTRLGYERKGDIFANRGIAPEDVAGLTGRPVQRVTVTLADDARFKAPGSSLAGGEVKLYRPGAKALDTAGKNFAKVRKPEDASGDGEARPRRQVTKTVTKFSPQPVLQRIETESGVTESWVTPSAQPQTAGKEAEPKAASKSESEAKPSRRTGERAFAPATSQRTETDSAVTESWATPPSSIRSEQTPQKSAKSTATPQLGEATEENSSSGSKARTDAGTRKSAGRDPLAEQHDHGSRYESYSAVPADEPGKDPAAPAEAAKKKSPSQAGGDAGTSTGSVSKTKRRWDGSGASGAPAVPPGLAQ